MAFIYFGFVGVMFSSCYSEGYKIVVIISDDDDDDDDWLKSVSVCEL